MLSCWKPHATRHLCHWQSCCLSLRRSLGGTAWGTAIVGSPSSDLYNQSHFCVCLFFSWHWNLTALSLRVWWISPGSLEWGRQPSYSSWRGASECSWVVLPGMAPSSLQVLLWDSRIDRPVKGLPVHLLYPLTRGSDGASSGHPVDPSTLPLKWTHYSIPSHRKVHTPSHRKSSCFLGTFLTHLRLTIISLLVCASGVLSDKRLLEKWKQACLFRCARGGIGLVHALIWYISASKMVPGFYYGIKYQHFGNSYWHSRDGVGVSCTYLPKYSRFSLECIFIILF